MTVSALLRRGLVAGVLAGLLAGLFSFLVGEPAVERAISFEALHAVAGAAAGPVSRTGQRAGLFLATGLYGLSVGGLFALLYAAARGRVGPARDGLLALGLAGALWV